MSLNKIIYPIAGFLLGSFIVQSCAVKVPKEVKPVKNFELDRYLGQWYEIARMDFKFEKNLDNTTATYTMKDNGYVKVDNKGYNYKKDKWQQSIGEARPLSKDKEGALKVSFFKPVWSGYYVVALDENYTHALVFGQSKDYMWILSRNKTMPEDVKQQYLQMAKDFGYETENLVWPKHDK